MNPFKAGCIVNGPDNEEGAKPTEWDGDVGCRCCGASKEVDDDSEAAAAARSRTEETSPKNSPWPWLTLTQALTRL